MIIIIITQLPPQFRDNSRKEVHQFIHPRGPKADQAGVGYRVHPRPQVYFSNRLQLSMAPHRELLRKTVTTIISGPVGLDPLPIMV
ncbi:hypothetical protein RIB2604_02001430 [Aspergillus luchuensis]|uniref:Uncharacterized protein n=1 Tax=Aspergillus kawachii TaxID=1069201 RepID=A0A146FI69_ASPKA|nr:hypothetical protein RIB2604_02001430 [Aspergillus luchuensis]